ncbi:MAG: discoidin domain-containing protein [Sporomusaceae bacterium]|jgi:hypothetical protein|nr:discoidin domain-containing protein [Sporomusaceae bacterium]
MNSQEKFFNHRNKCLPEGSTYFIQHLHCHHYEHNQTPKNNSNCNQNATDIDAHNKSVTAHPDIRNIINNHLKMPVWDSVKRTLTFMTENGVAQTIQLSLDSLTHGLEYDAATKELVLTREGGREVRVSISDLVDVYIGSVGNHIQINVDNNIIKAALINGSITEAQLAPSVVAKLNQTSGGGSSGITGAIGMTFLAPWTEDMVRFGDEVYLKCDGRTISKAEFLELYNILKYRNPERIPLNMTSDNTPVPFEASASGYRTATPGGDYRPFQAFSQTDFVSRSIYNDAWCSLEESFISGIGSEWLQIKLDRPYSIYGYSITIRNEWNSEWILEYPKDFTIQGSKDGVAWEDLDTVEDLTPPTVPFTTTKFFLDVPSDYYQYFRLTITKNNGYSHVCILDLSFFDNDVPVVRLPNLTIVTDNNLLDMFWYIKAK